MEVVVDIPTHTSTAKEALLKLVQMTTTTRKNRKIHSSKMAKIRSSKMATIRNYC